jgi:hypothetical protein
MTLGDVLSGFGLTVPRGSEGVLGRAGAFAEARRGRTRGLLTTRTLLFALGTSLEDIGGPELEKELIDELTHDFAELIGKSPRFEAALRDAFDPSNLERPEGQLRDERMQRAYSAAHGMPVSGNLRRILDRAAATARGLSEDILRSEHLLFGMLVVDKTRAEQILNKIGEPPAEICRKLFDQVPRSKSGWALTAWQGLLSEARGITGNSAPTSEASKSDETPPSDWAAVFARDADDELVLVLRRARNWAPHQHGYENPVLTPVVALVAMIESYDDRAEQWKKSASVWAAVAEGILAEHGHYTRWRSRVMQPSFEPHKTLRPGETIADVLTHTRSEDLENVLKMALTLRDRGFWTNELGLDHLFGAMVAQTDGSALAALEELGVVTTEGVARTIRRLPRHAKRIWEGFLGAAIRESAGPVLSPDALIEASFAADTPDADDLMDIEEEVWAFARYVAKEDLDTPLAIGLFGDWGSGKSFFMNRMNRFVGELAGRGESWCDDIVQIEFNAWHYIETNLWASLVEHILGALESWSKVEKNREDKLEELFQQFESAREVERESGRQLAEATQAKSDATRELATARSELARRIEARRSLGPATLWRAIETRFLTVRSENKEFDTAVTNAANALGIPKVNESAQEVKNLLDQAREMQGRARVLSGSLFSRKHNGWYWAGLVALIAAAPFIGTAVVNWLSEGNQFFDRLSSGVVELATVASLITAWVGRGLAVANSALTNLEGAREALDKEIENETVAQDKKVARAEARIARANERVDKAQERLSGAHQAVDAAKRAIEAETPRHRLSEFLRSRLESETYSRHLGVVSMIRKDFELLSNIMTNREWTPENRRRLREAEIDAANLRTFNRIILYIDDLDRCPSDRVVDVLQAVHLLLAFPLFVVVVGVDARWISRSLKKHYPNLLADNVSSDLEFDENGPRMKSDSDLVASSHDYLEKIFQVPYWVKPMDSNASKKFLRGLARAGRSRDDEPEGFDDDQGSSAGVGDNDDLRADGNVQDVTPAQQNGTDITPEGAPNETVETEAADDAGTSESDGTDEQLAEAPEIGEDAGQAEETESGEDVPVLIQLPLTDHEIDFMEILAPAVGRSPRRSKRFFNVYQLIRASLRAEERDTFVGGRGQALDYRAVMCLLAIVSGSPILAPRFFRVLLDDSARHNGFCDVRDYCKNDPSFTTLNEWRRLSQVLAIADLMGDESEVLDRMRHWTRRTMRFSFTARPIADTKLPQNPNVE